MAESNRNRRRSIANSSGAKGVYWNKRNRKWHAQITHNHRKIHLGYFANLAAAAAAYESAARGLHGDWCREVAA